MEKTKPYLTFSHPYPGPTSFLFKKAAELSAQRMRELTVPEHRAAMERLAEVRVISPGTRVMPVACAGVQCEWVYRDSCPMDKVILYIHGGSWAYGSLNIARPVGMLLSIHSGCRVLVVDYRLSPEHPYPAGLDDCAAVYDWLGDHGFAPERVALFGDSAGGNLSLALAHRLRGAGRAMPAAIGLASPVVDMTEGSMLARGMPDLLYTQHEGREQDIFSLYTQGRDRRDPLLSPLYGDLGGLPPLLIHVGQDEDLCVDCDVFAQKAHAAGAEVALKIWRGMYHDFTIVGNTLKESRQSLGEFAAFFKLHLG